MIGLVVKAWFGRPPVRILCSFYLLEENVKGKVYASAPVHDD